MSDWRSGTTLGGNVTIWYGMEIVAFHKPWQSGVHRYALIMHFDSIHTFAGC